MANTPDGAIRLTAIDCVSRGAASLRANWRLLIGVRVIRNLILLALLATSVILPILALGLDLWLDRPKNLDELDGGLEWLSDLADRLVWTPKLVAALVVMAALWLVAGYVYCFFQAGTYGVLAAADGETESARAFRWVDFNRWGRERFGRYFALANLYGVFLGAAVLLALLGAGAVASASEIWGALAAFGIGCFALFPVFLLLLGSGLWYEIACADLSREESSVRIATRRALAILRRRLGAVALLLVLFAAASMAIWLALFPLSALVSFTTNGHSLVALASQGLLHLMAALPSAAIETILVGAWVALVRSEAYGR
ncbi:MAG TPA: hypothetical protein VGS22_27060 [Thermoanaerobaculia bacterium]|jgi:hypothetical protein|nr:hypothetical protein [Thermoanaerobaculia bacterium]